MVIAEYGQKVALQLFGGKREKFGENPAPVPPRPPQISYDIIRVHHMHT
jgi:hypothetical protein